MSPGSASSPARASSAPISSNCSRTACSRYSPANLPASRSPASDRARRSRNTAIRPRTGRRRRARTASRSRVASAVAAARAKRWSGAWLRLGDPQVVGDRGEDRRGVLGPARHAEIGLGDAAVAVARQESRPARSPAARPRRYVAASSAGGVSSSRRRCSAAPWASRHSARSISMVTLCGTPLSTVWISPASATRLEQPGRQRRGEQAGHDGPGDRAGAAGRACRPARTAVAPRRWSGRPARRRPAAAPRRRGTAATGPRRAGPGRRSDPGDRPPRPYARWCAARRPAAPGPRERIAGRPGCAASPPAPAARSPPP